MVNIYRQRFSAICPSGGETVYYHLTIRSKNMIMAEAIRGFCYELPAGYQEDIADQLYKQFGGEQILVANHLGTEIETRRGCS